MVEGKWEFYCDLATLIMMMMTTDKNVCVDGGRFGGDIMSLAGLMEWTCIIHTFVAKPKPARPSLCIALQSTRKKTAAKSPPVLQPEVHA